MLPELRVKLPWVGSDAPTQSDTSALKLKNWEVGGSEGGVGGSDGGGGSQGGGGEGGMRAVGQ